MSEHNEQVALFEWAALMAKNTYPALEWLFAIPNGGHRHKAVASKMKAEGVKSGVLDVMLPYPAGLYCGLFIEMKWNGNKPTDNQKTWIKYLNTVGYLAVVCNGCDEAIEAIERYLS